MDIPDTLSQRMDLFASHGRLMLRPDELFREPSWTAVMLGQGLHPRGVDPVAASRDAGTRTSAMARMKSLIERGVSVMPTHSEFLSDPKRRDSSNAVNPKQAA